MSLNFYPYGIVLQHNTPEGTTEKIVAPSDLARAISTNIQWSTGIIDEDIIFVGEKQGVRTTVGFRKPQRTGIWLESPEALRVPMPGLVLIRTVAGSAVNYAVYAVKSRPTLKTELYNAPLPNTYPRGDICWGNVQRPNTEAIEMASLVADWRILLGTGFNSHAVGGKSEKHRDDIRKLLFELHDSRAKKYPTDDLVKTSYTLGAVLSGGR